MRVVAIEKPSSALDDLRDAFVDVLDATVPGLGPHVELFAGASAQLGAGVPNAPGVSASLPVVDQWLDQALDRGETAPGPVGTLARCLRAAGPELTWKMAYEQLESTPELEAYRAHYSWVPLAVPAARGEVGPFDAGDMLVGFSIQAPGVLYPHHHHRAPELYGVISGPIDWQVGTTPWATKQAGDVIVHRSSESHSMRTNDEPALTWVIWPRDTDSTVYMPSMDPPGQTTEPTVYPSSSGASA